MSTKTGLILFQNKAWVVATKVKGVVMTSPEMSIPCKAIWRAKVPLLNKQTLSVSNMLHNSRVNRLRTGPSLVNHPDSQISSSASVNSANGGKKGLVT